MTGKTDNIGRLPSFGMEFGDKLTLSPVPNGGWLVTIRSRSMGGMGERIGAFTSTKDMFDALGEAFGIKDK